MDQSDVAAALSAGLSDLPSKALSGDVFAVSIILLSFYVLVLLINALTQLIVVLLKKVILLVIVSLAFYKFAEYMIKKIELEGTTPDNLILGGFGLLAGCLAFIVAFNAAFASLRKIRPKKEAVTEEKAAEATGERKEVSKKEILSLESIKKDRGLGVVLAYLIVAEFGVISSKTVAAPNATVGILFFFAFMTAALFFIRQSYSDYNTGIRHFLATLVAGGALSMLLGHLWGGHDINFLLSPEYFKTDAMVAFVTGMAVSLFMGSKS
ncbi:MAG: hypothetical protein JW724_02005 [Candidatus Altiarchaeota archaeon]|nr:hypothetical protein [Candidatus Altiarchaeota archaeon]